MQVTGSTTDDWQEALRWACLNITHKTIIISNVGSNAMDVEVYTLAHPDSQEFLETSQTLNADDMLKLTFKDAYAQIVIKVKSNVSGSPTNYVIDYCGW